MNEQLFKQINEWQKQTFPQANSISKLAHLIKEIVELKDAINDEDHTINHEAIRKTKMEYADCFLLLFGSAGAYGMSFQDIEDAIKQKFEINQKRKWGTPDADGVVQHLKARLVHCKKEPYDVYIGRSADLRSDEHFGNPFSHKTGTNAVIVVESRDEAIKQFRMWLAGEDWVTLKPDQRKWILDNLHTLKGKTLGCWCYPQSCHGDVLLELVNK